MTARTGCDRTPCYHLAAPPGEPPWCGISRSYPVACIGCRAYDPIVWPADRALYAAWRRVLDLMGTDDHD